MPDFGSVIINFGSSLPNWLLLILFIVAVAITYLQYVSDSNFNRPQRLFLSGLRVISLLLIIVLLSEPILRVRYDEEVKNGISVYLDASSSAKPFMADGDNDEIATLTTFFSALNSSFLDVSYFIFGQEVQEIDDLSQFQNNENSFEITDLEVVHNHIKGSGTKLALVLSDGIQTSGSQPYFENIANKPIYSVTLGDTTRRPILAIEDMVIPEKVYRNETFAIRTIINISNINDDKLSFKLLKKQNATFELLTDSTVNLTAENKRIAITRNITLSNEESEALLKVEISSGGKNISRTNLIPILDKELKIASIATNLHPDVASFRRILRTTKSVSLSSYNNFEQASLALSLDTLDLLVLHANLATIERYSEGYPNLPIIAFVQQTNMQIARSLVFADVNLERQTSFSTSLGLPRRSLPPLSVAIPAISIPNTTPLLYATIKEFQSDVPIILANETSTKHIYLTADSWYRWLNYPDENIQKYTENLFSLLVERASYLNENNKINKLSWPKNWITNKYYDLGLSVSNEIGNNDKDVVMEYRILSENKTEIENGFTQANAEGLHSLRVNFIKEGTYTIRLKASKNGVLIDSTNTNIYVEALNLEDELKIAQPKVLADWTNTTDGENLGYADSLETHLMKLTKILDDRGLNNVNYVERIQSYELAKSYWWFILLLGLLSIEWIIRRLKNSL